MKYRGKVSNAESLGRMVAQGRLLNHLTQRELADRLGISQRYVWEIEAGKPTKYTDRLFAMFRATGVTLMAEIEAPDGSSEPGSVDRG